MKRLKRTLCLLLVLAMTVAALSGCGKPEEPNETVAGFNVAEILNPQNRRGRITVAEFEEWLNAKLLEMEYPLEVSFLEPEEDGYAKSDLTYTGTGEDIYTEYLYFYVYLDQNMEYIILACVSARENCSEEVLQAHKKLSVQLGSYFESYITEAHVEEIFDTAKAFENGQTPDAASSIRVDQYENNRLSASLNTGFYRHMVTVEPDTGHIWYDVYAVIDNGEECTLPAVAEVQQLINEGFQGMGYPAEIVFLDSANEYKEGFLIYTGDDKDPFYLSGMIGITLYMDSEGSGIEAADVHVTDSAGEEAKGIQTELSALLATHYFSDLPRSDVEQLFDIEPKYDENYEYEGPLNVFVYADEYLFGCQYDIDNDSHIVLESYPESGQRFYLSITPNNGEDVPDDEPEDPVALEYPITADAFTKLYEETSSWLSMNPVASNRFGAFEEKTFDLVDGEGNRVLQIALLVRSSDNVINRIDVKHHSSDYIWNLLDEVAFILSECDPTVDREAFSDACWEKYYAQYAWDSRWLSDWDTEIIECRILNTNDWSHFRIDFPMERAKLLEENYFVAMGKLPAPSVVDGKFAFRDPDLKMNHEFHTSDSGFVDLIQSYFDDMGVPLNLLWRTANLGSDGLESDLVYSVEEECVYHVYTDDGITLNFPIYALDLYDIADDEAYQIVYNSDPTMFMDEFDAQYLEAIGSDFVLDEETLIQLHIALSMLCDDGMTAVEAKKLFTNTYAPFKTEDGILYTIYAPREVVHALREDPETGEIVYTVLTKADYEQGPVTTAAGEILYTVVE